MQYIAVMLADHSSFNGAAESAASYTPLIATAIYEGMICILNVIPMSIRYAVVGVV